MRTSTGPSESFQIPIEAAERYESAFVPAFFAQWATILCESARLRPGDVVLDVACGTGIVARTAADLVGAEGRVVGLDVNDAMLTVARRVRPDLDWRNGDVAAMPLPDQSFGVVLCQMALMFFPDRAAAVREMARVVDVGGTVAVLVPAQLAAQLTFAPFVDMVAGHAGPGALSLLSTYFACGDLGELTTMLGSAGLDVELARPRGGTYRAPSVDEFVATEVESTPLRARLSIALYDRIRSDAHQVLAPFTTAEGSVVAPFECNVVVARRR